MKILNNYFLAALFVLFNAGLQAQNNKIQYGLHASFGALLGYKNIKQPAYTIGATFKKKLYIIIHLIGLGVIIQQLKPNQLR